MLGPPFQTMIDQQLVLGLLLGNELHSTSSGSVQTSSLEIMADVKLGVQVCCSGGDAG